MMQKHDGLPENVCLDCVLKMEATVNFIKKCEDSDRELRSNIKENSFKKRKLELFNDLMSFTVDDEPSTSAAVQVIDENHLENNFNMQDTYDDSDKDSVICLDDDEDYFGDAEVTKDLTEKSKEIRPRRLSEETGSLCNICGQHFPFGQITQFNSHLISHGDKNFKCTTCRKAFYTQKSLNVHAKIHVATKEFACEICGKTFARSVGLREHVKYVHMKEKEFPCEFCNKTFYRPDYFKKHLSVVHKKEQNYLCKICNESFPFLHLFQEHNLIHKGEPDFHCQHCEDKFHTEKLLLDHERSHTEETPYTCPTCFAGFLRPHQLKKHGEKMHNIEIDFADLVD